VVAGPGVRVGGWHAVSWGVLGRVGALGAGVSPVPGEGGQQSAAMRAWAAKMAWASGQPSRMRTISVRA
jgi:hypothetical protein